MIIWLTGQPGSGKTTIAQQLLEENVVNYVLDGDDLRKLMPNPGYDEKGRRQNIDRAQAIAGYLNQFGVWGAVALVSPYRDQREEFKARHRVLEVYLHTDEERGREQFFADDYEPPEDDYLDIDTAVCSVEEAVGIIRGALATVAQGTRVADQPEAENESALRSGGPGRTAR